LPIHNRPDFDLAQIGALEFEHVNYEQFPCLSLALESGKKGGTYPAVLCAADEVAVEEFLCETYQIHCHSKIVAETLERHRNNRILN